MVEPQRWGRPGVEGSEHVTDLTVQLVVDRCRAYWLGSGVSEEAANEMTGELRSHLADAISAGKSVEAVTGTDIDAFA